jgi:hypothetical protein
MKFSNIVKIFALLFVLGAWTNAQAQTAVSTWQDNSGNGCTPQACDQEDRFIVEFAAGSNPFAAAGTTPPNVTTFNHDVSGYPVGTIITYRVCGENTAGKACSGGVKYTVPAAPPPVQQVVIPIPPGAVGVQFVFPVP